MRSYLIWSMAVASGATVANLYYNQPLLAVMAQSLHASAHAAGFIPILTQIGYAMGILLFVPLGDLMERRRLIVTMLGATALALSLAAMSPSITWLVGASFAIGITAIAAQIVVPFAAGLANPQERGRIVGTVIGVWCYFAYRLTSLPAVANVLTRYGKALVPFVLIGLGIFILLDSGTYRLLVSQS